MIDLHVQRYALLALLAAALFGVSTPLAKLLLGSSPPIMLAGLLYLGSGLGLLIVQVMKRCAFPDPSSDRQEFKLQEGDYVWLAGAVAVGGVAAPVLLLWGLSGSSASSASLLLNLEGVMTTLLAAALFREAVGRVVWMGSFVMLAAGLALAYDPHATHVFSLNSLAIVGACLMWALDNNLTRNISTGNPTAIAMIKGLAAGTVNIGLGLANGAALPEIGSLAAAMLLGFFGYGISLVLFIYALRHLGSARTAAHFSTAPFLGAIVSILLLGEPLTATFVLALILMVFATWLVLTEQHGHEHHHEYLAHMHRHTHEEHHRHVHDDGSEGLEPHTHFHVHVPMTHSHPHLPDVHHRHRH
ncbi:MAG: DMT family transporter [Betaproteobacteria bacterium]|nr:DMT family transporter [Betaproteobacteria bacterium]